MSPLGSQKPQDSDGPGVDGEDDAKNVGTTAEEEFPEFNVCLRVPGSQRAAIGVLIQRIDRVLQTLQPAVAL